MQNKILIKNARIVNEGTILDGDILIEGELTETREVDRLRRKA